MSTEPIPSPRPNLHVRPATPADCMTVFEWRNHPNTYRYFFSTAGLTLDEHTTWFHKVLQDETRHLLIGCDSQGRKVGVIRFDLADDDLQAEVHLYVAPDLAGQGFGTALLQAGQDWLGANTNVERVIAKVMDANEASHRLFAGAGYKPSYRVWELSMTTERGHV